MQNPSEETMRRVSENMRAFVAGATSSVVQCLVVSAGVQQTVIVSDDDLEYWGNFFVENRFHARGILFETFMLHPFGISQAVLFRGRLRDPEDFLPLLPRQRDVARGQHPHVRAISKPLPPVRDSEVHNMPADILLDLPIFLRKQAD